MRLSALTKGFAVQGGVGDPEITLVTEDSRRVRPGAAFVAVPGTAEDGHRYIGQALDRGAAAIIVEREDALPRTSVAHVVVPRARVALASMAARFYGCPSQRLSLIGFTGTFGKTTTSEVLRELFDAAGMKPAVIGSLGVRFNSFVDDGDGLTTPSPPQLHGWLAALAARGAQTIIMEVTSHALRLERLAGVTLGGGLLAAILPGEHTDFHRSYDDYVGAKRLFLDYLQRDAILAYDADNRPARQLARDAAVRGKAGVTFGPPREGLLPIRAVVLDEDGAFFHAGDHPVRSALLGRRNVRNVGLALTYALAAGMPLTDAVPVLASLQPLRRRMERFSVAGRTVLDDTSGHPDSLVALFEVVDLIPREQLWVVWAIRGSRGPDLSRANALALADLASMQDANGIFVTASADVTEPKDHVRDEEVDTTRDALQGKGRPFTFLTDLSAAMNAVAERSRPGDLIVLAGAQGMNDGRMLLQDALGSG